MINQYAVVENGVVINVILWDGTPSSWTPPDGTAVEPIPSGIQAGIGYSFNGSEFVAPID